jgi:hypothetical protein
LKDSSNETDSQAGQDCMFPTEEDRQWPNHQGTNDGTDGEARGSPSLRCLHLVVVASDQNITSCCTAGTHREVIGELDGAESECEPCRRLHDHEIVRGRRSEPGEEECLGKPSRLRCVAIYLVGMSERQNVEFLAMTRGSLNFTSESINLRTALLDQG